MWVCRICNVWMCVSVGFVMYGYVCVCECVCVCVWVL